MSVKKAKQYVKDILSGKQISCVETMQAVQRYQDDLVRKDIYLDEEASERVFTFFSFIRLVEGEMAGQLFEPTPEQSFIVLNVFGWKKLDGRRRFSDVVIEVPRKFGKMLALDTLVPTPNGFSTMGELKENDIIFGGDGKQCRVVRKSEIDYNPESYLMTFSNGEQIKACAEHQWQVLNIDDRKDKKPYIKTTKELFSKQGTVSKSAKWFVLKTNTIETNKKDLPIDPYLLGMWLGDGTTANGHITNPEQEIVDEIKRISERSGYKFRLRQNKNRCQTLIVKGGFKEDLRKLGVLENKHIPEDYLFSSHEDRLNLLRGLLDSDSHISEKYGSVEFCSTVKNIAEGVRTLASSFGWKTSITQSESKLYGVKKKDRYRVSFCPDRDNNPFFLKRKADIVSDKTKKRNKRYYISSIVPCDPVPMQCIEVDSFDNTYLVGQTYIRTHNTTFLAVLGLYGLFGDNEMRSQVYSGGTTKDQAAICFDIAKLMAENTPEFSSRLNILTRNVSHTPTASFFRYMASDTKKLDGFNPHFAILDEVHAYKTNEMYEIFKSGMGARVNPLIFMITTAGFYKEWWYYKTQRKHLKRVLSGDAEDDSLFGIIYTLDEGDNWEDESVWPKAIPNLGYNVSYDFVRGRVLAAKNKPSDRNAILTKQFNIWTDGIKTWIPNDKWKALYVPEPNLKGLKAFGGVDLSYIRDITAYTLAFTLPNGKKYLKHRFFVPYDTAQQRQESTGYPYMDWIGDGWLIANDGNTIDYNVVKKYIIDDLRTYDIHTIGFDKANASHIMQEINDEVSPLHLNIDGKWQFINRVYGISPHIKTISPPTKEFERMVFCDDPEICHDGNPVMEWMIKNVAIKSNSEGDIRPDKEKSEEKIDGVMSSILSIEQMLFWSKIDTSPRSKYEDDDLLML